ncbi:dihydroorotase, homodimeric type [Legionella birminghamensis]|uniref:Dihydroorotase n=2 Tax=Legionella birminghamensis TaxID=28083 RepID=A0A378I608_9GAMM|nr:dihydroorotase, homodimeric type [Legionella birminghamensis]STX30599.1 dihydroorotase, homodimeric type [Legionella birminghamensis]
MPDDWHVHFRDGIVLKDTVNATAKHFARALVMPNLKPALTTLEAVLAYRQRIMDALSESADFNPLMTFYLNESVSPGILDKARQYDYILGAKLYPAGATTNSDQGAKSISSLYPLLEVMQDRDLVLQIHGETVEGDIFEREEDFIINYLAPILSNFPKLRIVLEHISTAKAVEFVQDGPQTLAATITPHHLLYNRNQLLAGGIKPHYYCLPILKHRKDQLALQAAAFSGNPRFFAGTDSAPHALHNKESACGCAGIYSAPYAVPFYTKLFDEGSKLPLLNGFLSQYGADFYKLPRNNRQLHLIKKAQTIPAFLALGTDKIVPMAAGEVLSWSVDV